jgi:hypothetical protein
MRVRSSFVPLFGFALLCAACGADSSSEARAAGVPALKSGSDAGAMADLQASTKWAEPRCRWIETGAHVLAWPQDTEVMMAARDLGYLDMEEVGSGNRTGRREPAWRVQMTAAGRTEAAKCGKGSARSNVFGIPVSQRRFVSGTRTTEPTPYNPDQAMFDVEFEWAPTAAGDRVKSVLTGNMAVEQGPATARLTMSFGDRAAGRGANGWAVASIDDNRFVAR